LELGKRQVQKYWDGEPCNTRAGEPFPEGSLEFFEKIEASRYKDQSFIHSFVQFTRWRGKKVLEMGCGCGTDFIQFARARAEAYGIDMSLHSVELTKKRLSLYGLNAEVMVGDGENLPLASEQFDLVYSWGVLHHTPDTGRAIKEIYRILKPGGYLKAMVYHRFSTMGWVAYLKYGLLRGKPFTSLSKVMSQFVESPGTKAFSRGEVESLFSSFSDLKIQPVLIPEAGGLKGTPFLPLLKFYPSGLASWIAVEGRKQV
jgi:ubiquinone/menaquinone biosynthesis C-methylase UbiE